MGQSIRHGNQEVFGPLSLFLRPVQSHRGKPLAKVKQDIMYGSYLAVVVNESANFELSELMVLTSHLS